MPNIDLEKHGRAIQLAISSFNALVLLLGLLWYGSQFYGDTKSAGTAQANFNKAIEAKIESLGSQQQTTNVQLEGIKTQMRYVENSVGRVERAVERIAPKL